MAAQAAVLAESFGLDPSLFIRAVTGTNTDSPYLHYRAAQLTGTSDEVLSPVRAAIKDLGHIRSAASSAAVPELLLATLQQIYDGAADAGLATQGLSTRPQRAPGSDEARLRRQAHEDRGTPPGRR